ncbi:DUF2141 domain-containing protein [Sphingomonas sp. CL5.1]|uniref:DUF2141 domain-containing protein n=1 Tax=Sphingomonas sp. CL5.1 TaxID=2653203 RepID=UPI001582150C|nr:DUF2141 domain-containing protein [Sphingomonas sp. CL5.1]QKR98770.1 DUF2141 domain-containing protein [Sphingomonas sp. CL5.1]
MVRCRLIPFVAALLPLLAPLAAAAQPVGETDACVNGPGIRAEIVGMKDRQGSLKLELFPATEQDFLRDDHDLLAEGKVFRRVWVATPHTGPVVMCIRVPHPGSYAILFTHDRDGKNKFNFWTDGAGVPGNQKLGRSRPKLANALVNVGNGVTTVVIRAQYLHGFPPAFGPVGE